MDAFLNPPELDLRNGMAHARIALRGAELLAWSVKGLAVLWRADPAWWRATSPILFPLVGRCRDGGYWLGGRRYTMGLHGFAAGRDFAMVRHAADQVILQLVDDEATREQYPFAFRLRASYRLEQAGLQVRLEVANPGPAPLPYALGFHPGFRWPLGEGSRQNAAIRFGQTEAADVPIVTQDGLFSARTRRLAFDGRLLPLSDDLFDADALCWFGLNSRSASYESGGAAIRIDWRNFPHLALWTRPGAPFICIEHWTAASDAEDFSGEITDKPGIQLLPPAARRSATISYRVELPTHE